MSLCMKAVYFLCDNLEIDPVAGRVFNEVSKKYNLEETDIIVDDKRVLKYSDHEGKQFYFVKTHKVVCHSYDYYLPILNKYFSDFDFAGLLTWHEGNNAPDRILSVHTTGDVVTGYFGSANPEYMHNLLMSLEKNRVEADLTDFKVITEATHWSGIIYKGGTPDMIPKFKVPIVDIEIGSTVDSWSNDIAAKIIAMSLFEVFTHSDKKLYNLLCAGGVHFEHAFADAVFQSWDYNSFGISHILANQWLVSGQYDIVDRQQKLEACVDSIQGGIDGIVMHDNLKGCYKEQLRILGRKYNVPVFKHQLLRRPWDIQFSVSNT